MPPEPLLTPAEVSTWVRIPVGTLANWRTAGGGPPYVKCGARVLYEREAVQRWLDNRTELRTPVPSQRKRGAA